MRLFGLAAAVIAAPLLLLAPAASSKPAPQPAPVQALAKGVDIPFEQFTLPNGLRVIVHTDRSAPVVAVAAWYNVGSKDEPAGKTGFAHLFEHIMLFNGTENVANPTEVLRNVGATDWNGTTWFDRTNYFETVPTPALERALYLESERMGHLLGALTQERLDNQRGVVQNEKRQGDNNPYGLVQYAQLEALFPEGHPYRHSTIGSMADLDGATLDDVRAWFRENYGPNNAVLVLAGDVDAKTARPLVEKWFGGIPRGPVNTPAAADVPTLKAPVSAVMHDRVSNTRLYRSWAVPGLTDKDQVPLDVAARILGGLASSRLDNALVRGDQTAVGVTAGVLPFQRVSIFTVTVDVKPGADVEAVSGRLDALIADFLAKGPTEDEVRRAVVGELSRRTFAAEAVGGFGGKAVTLAEGALYADDPGFYRRRNAEYASLTPAAVADAARRWLSRPVWSLRVDPGAREAYAEAAAEKRTPPPSAPPPPKAERPPMPAVAEIANLDFPTVERARLSNGVEVVYARRAGVPVTLVAAEFEAGVAADSAGAPGRHKMMLDLLEEGTVSMDATALAEAQERLGATINVGASLDRSAVNLAALSANLDPSLALMSDIVRNPAFRPADVERRRNQQLASIAAEKTQPLGLARRTLPPLLYGANHPYGRAASGWGETSVISAVTREDLAREHQAWIRPDNARVFVVSDLPLSALKPKLEAAFGGWKAPAAPKGVRTVTAPAPQARPRIVLVDRPQSPQSVIYAGAVLPVTGRDDLLTLLAANEVLGDDFLSRLNTEVRERKGWSYGVFGFINQYPGPSPYIIQAPVQSDRTGDSVRALIGEFRAFAGDKGVSASERDRTINGSMRELPGLFAGSQGVMNVLRSNALLGRPDDYWEKVAPRYRAMTAADMDRAARSAIDISRFTWVIVGDAEKVRPQLDGLGLEVEVVKPQ
jgi:predicted Zn-dependent peptidase